MDKEKFASIADSLRQYRRADLRDFQDMLGGNPVDTLYVDPLPGDAVLRTTLSNNTTFLIGRKGTGKSTIFAKAQSELRKRQDVISVYLDVKSLYEQISTANVPVISLQDQSISESVYRAHMLRKAFLAAIIAELVKEINKVATNLPILQRLVGKKKAYETAIQKLDVTASLVKQPKLVNEEIPILRRITQKTRNREEHRENTASKSGITAKANPMQPSVFAEASTQDIDETLSDNEIYTQYSDAILRSFPFSDLLNDIRELLVALGMKRLIIFFDDFSEISFIDQKLFVDVILAPLNNASDEYIKLKIAGYPGRIYYGKIDPVKVTTLSLDFYNIYKAKDLQTIENSAIDYTTRLIEKRFEAFGEDFGSYLDTSVSIEEFMRLLFEATFNVPRLMGIILYNCYLDRISKDLTINLQSVKLAAQKSYETVVQNYFLMNRYALEPFDQKVDRHIQKKLLDHLVSEARDVKRRIVSRKVGGIYSGFANPPVSHFAVSPNQESIFSSLELNFLLTKYYDMRDRDGNDISIYAFNYGLCEAERFTWGYPKGKPEFRKYFVERFFNYNGTIQEFLAKSQTIRCPECGVCLPMEKKSHLETYQWRCPSCNDGICSIVNLADDFKNEIQSLDKDIMLEPVEIEILEVLDIEKKPMRASEISVLLDITYQFAGKRTEKLKEMNLVEKQKGRDNWNRSQITSRAKDLYFTGDVKST